MKINSNFKLENAVSDRSDRRASLKEIRVTRRHAIASDGFILAVVPVQFEENDTEGFLSAEALKKARKLSGKRDTPTIKLNGSQELSDGSTLPRPEPDTYPKIGAIIRNASQNKHFRIGLDASCLARLADAIGSDKVELVFSDSPKKAIFVRGMNDESGYGILMPVNISR